MKGYFGRVVEGMYFIEAYLDGKMLEMKEHSDSYMKKANVLKKIDLRTGRNKVLSKVTGETVNFFIKTTFR